MIWYKHPLKGWGERGDKIGGREGKGMWDKVSQKLLLHGSVLRHCTFFKGCIYVLNIQYTCK